MTEEFPWDKVWGLQSIFFLDERGYRNGSFLMSHMDSCHWDVCFCCDPLSLEKDKS